MGEHFGGELFGLPKGRRQILIAGVGVLLPKAFQQGPPLSEEPFPVQPGAGQGPAKPGKVLFSALFSKGFSPLQQQLHPADEAAVQAGQLVHIPPALLRDLVILPPPVGCGLLLTN